MKRHLLSTLEGEELAGMPWDPIVARMRTQALASRNFAKQILPGEIPQTTPQPTQTSSKTVVLVAALGVGLYLLTRKG